MSNKKVAIIVAVFIAVLFLIIGFIALAGHVPVFSRILTFLFSIILVIFVVGFFIIIAKRKK